MTEAGTDAREATRADKPRGAEAQCVICWRMFSRNSSADGHKLKGADAGRCVDPASLGFEFYERRGLRVWHTPGGDWREKP